MMGITEGEESLNHHFKNGVEAVEKAIKKMQKTMKMKSRGQGPRNKVVQKISVTRSMLKKKYMKIALVSKATSALDAINSVCCHHISCP